MEENEIYAEIERLRLQAKLERQASQDRIKARFDDAKRTQGIKFWALVGLSVFGTVTTGLILFWLSNQP